MVLPDVTDCHLW